MQKLKYKNIVLCALCIMGKLDRQNFANLGIHECARAYVPSWPCIQNLLISSCTYTHKKYTNTFIPK